MGIFQYEPRAGSCIHCFDTHICRIRWSSEVYSPVSMCAGCGRGLHMTRIPIPSLLCEGPSFSDRPIPSRQGNKRQLNTVRGDLLCNHIGFVV